MPLYKYLAVNSNSENVHGLISGDNAESAENELLSRNLIVISLEEASEETVKKQSYKKFGFVKTKDIAWVFSRLSSMLRSGVGLVDCLETMAEVQKNKRLKGALLDIAADIRSGASFSDGLKEHKNIFRLSGNVVGMAEISGELPETLERLANQFNATAERRRQIISAMMYPVVVFLVMSCVVIFLVHKVFPVLTRMINSHGYKTPLLTKIVITAGNIITSHWPYIVIAIGLALYILMILKKKKKTALQVDKYSLNIPIFGKIFREASINSWAFGMSSLLRSGVTLQESLGLVSTFISNAYIKEEVLLLQERIAEGSSLSESIRGKPNVFDPVVRKIILVGEQTGTLAEAFEELADVSNEEMTYQIKILGILIEPVIIASVGAIVAIVYMGFFLAYFSAIKM
jgi:type IV pilus assembly protein PilC